MPKQLSRLVEADLKFIEKASERIMACQDDINTVKERFNKLNPDTGSEKDYRDLKKIVKKLKHKISYQHKDEHESHLWADGGAKANGTSADSAFDQLNLTKNAAFELTLVFKEFEASYHELSMELKLCLLSFSIFPENAGIKKRVMIYWWMGEEFVPPLKASNNNATVEQFANDYFKKLVAKGFVVPVHEKRRHGEYICKMDPFVRSMVIKLACQES